MKSHGMPRAKRSGGLAPSVRQHSKSASQLVIIQKMEFNMTIAESFGRSGFARFINSPAGRIARIVVGIAFIIWGYLALDSGSGVILILIGFVPLLAGVLDLCLVSALLGGSIRGSSVRSLSQNSPKR